MTLQGLIEFIVEDTGLKGGVQETCLNSAPVPFLISTGGQARAFPPQRAHPVLPLPQRAGRGPAERLTVTASLTPPRGSRKYILARRRSFPGTRTSSGTTLGSSGSSTTSCRRLRTR